MDIRNLLETKLSEFDSSLDLTEGSDLQRNVIQPIVDALGVDPLSVDTRTFLVAKLTELFPDDVIARGSAVNDILIGAAQLFFEGYRRELNAVKNASSILNIDTLTDDDASGLAANWFVPRATGTRASGSVTVTLDSATSFSVSPAATTFYTASGTRFVPIAPTLYTTEQLLALQVGARRYEAVINVVAVDDGVESNVGAGTITRATGINNLVSVRNDSATAGGSNRDSTQYLLSSKLPRAISERSLVTARGIGARISSSINGLLRYQIIGMGDAEMTRDRVSFDAGGLPVLSGFLFTYGAYALITGVLMGEGGVRSGDRALIRQLDGSVHDVVVQRVLAESSVSPLYASGPAYIVALDVPSAGAHRVIVQRSTTAQLGSTTLSREAGLGGRTDVYLRSDRLTTSSLSATQSQPPISGVSFSIDNSGYSIALLDITDADLARVERGHVLSVLGEARIITRVRTRTLDVGVPLSAALGAYARPWLITPSLTYETAQGDVRVYPRAGGELTASAPIGSSEVVLTGGDFVAAGVTVGDVLSVPSAGLSAPITSIGELGLVQIDVPSPQTFSGAPALVTRPSSAGIAPLIGPSVGDVDYRHPLSIDVSYVEQAETIIAAGTGRVLLPLGYALQALSLNPDFAPFARSTPERPIRTSVTDAEGETAFNQVAAFSRGYRDEVPGVAELVALTTMPVFTIVEVPIFNDVFTADAHNVIALMGDISDTTEDAAYPAAGVTRGDILEVSIGPLAGRYVIEGVLHIDLPADHSAASLSFEAGVRHPRPPRVYGAPLPGQVQRVSLVRIYGALPSTGEDVLAPELRVETGDVSASLRPLTLASLLAYINDPSQLIRAGLADELAQNVVDAYLAHGAAVRADTITHGGAAELLSTLVQANVFDYTIIRATRAWGTVHTRNGGHVCLAQPSVRRIDLEDIFESQSLLHVKHEEPTLLHGPDGALLVVDPDRPEPHLSTWSRSFSLPNVLPQEDTLLYPEYESAQRTMVVVSDSTAEAPELNDPCTFIVRPEAPIVDAVAQRVLNTRSLGYQLFGIPNIGEAYEGDVIVITSAGETIDNVTALTIADATTLLTDDGHINAVDGAGTSMAQAIAGYQMFLLVEYGVDNRVNKLISQVGRRIVVEANGVRTDEFILGARMPHVLYLPSGVVSPGPARAIAAIGETSDKLDFIPSWAGGSVTAPAPGMDVSVHHAGSTYWRRVISRVDNSVFLDSPLPFGTPSVVNYGICALDIANKTIELTSDSIYTGLSTEYVSPDIDISTNLHLGGALHVPSASDVGRQVTLWALTHNDISLEDMYPGLLREEPATQAELEAGITAPVRRSIGQFNITSVDIVAANVGPTGTSPAVRVTLGIDAPDKTSIFESIDRETPFVRCSFAITDTLLDVEEGVINNIVEVAAYERVPDEFPVVGVSVYADNRYVVQGDSDAYYTRVTRGDYSCDVLAAFVSTSNAYIRPHRLTLLADQERVRVSALHVPSDLVRTSLSAKGEGVYGYDIAQRDPSVASSSEENIIVSLPPRNEVAATSVTVTGRYDPAIAQAQALLSSALERAAASHSLAMSMRPCVLGLDVTYVGGASVARAKSTLSDVVRQSLISQGSVTEALIVKTLTQLGASDVLTPITLYVCFADRTGRVVRRLINGALTEASLYDVDTTLRTMYLELPEDGERTLGAALNLTRVTSRINLIGTGGA